MTVPSNACKVCLGSSAGVLLPRSCSSIQVREESRTRQLYRVTIPENSMLGFSYRIEKLSSSYRSLTLVCFLFWFYSVCYLMVVGETVKYFGKFFLMSYVMCQ